MLETSGSQLIESFLNAFNHLWILRSGSIDQTLLIFCDNHLTESEENWNG